MLPDGEEISELRWFTREELAEAMALGEVAASRRHLDRAPAGGALVRRPAARTRPPSNRRGSADRVAGPGPGSGWSARCRRGRPRSARSGSRR